MKAIEIGPAGRRAGSRAATAASAQNEQFIPMAGYWVGPYAPGGSGIFGGMIDYVNMINARDGGINGVKLTWEKCETEYNNARGVECYERLKKKGPTGATVVHPLSTGITYSLIDKATADKIPVISLGYGRTDAVRRPRVPVRLPAGHQLLVAEHRHDQVHRHEGRRDGQAQGQEDRELYHDSAYGKETDPGARRAGEEVRLRGHAHPGAAPGQRAGVRSGCRSARSSPTG